MPDTTPTTQPAATATAAFREVESDPWGVGDESARPLRGFGAVAGDLADLRRDSRGLDLPASLVGASAPSSSPTALFRTSLVSDSSRGGETLEQVRTRRGTIALSHQIIDLTLQRPDGSPKQSDGSATLWSLIEGILAAGDANAPAIARGGHITGRRAPAPTLPTEVKGPRPAPEFVEWLMGL